MDPPVRTLVDGIALDHEATYELLLQEYGPRVIACVRRQLRAKGLPETGTALLDPEDVLQDAILDLVRFRHRLHFSSLADAGDWLLRRARVWWYRRYDIATGFTAGATERPFTR